MTATDDAVLVVSCGGTFDKSKFTRSGKFVCGQPQAEKILAEAGIEDIRYEVQSLMRKDSLDMDDEDREQVAASVAAAAHNRIVVVHGTDTLVDTAQHLLQHDFGGKTVVVVGAMRPAVFTGSDASFNLGFAMAVALLQPPGVWVAMHGQVWRGDQVLKDTEKMKFVSKATG